MNVSRLARRLALAAVLSVPAYAYAEAPTKVEVWKTPTCGCCEDWVKHMRDNGFEVIAHDVQDTGPIRRNAGMADYGSCHTAAVGGYAIEGHVPASDVRRLLLEKPEAAGLAARACRWARPAWTAPSTADARRRTTCCWSTSAAAPRCSRPTASVLAGEREQPQRACGYSLHRSKNAPQ